MSSKTRQNDIARRESRTDRKSTRLNSSHRTISYAVFCLKKKKNTNQTHIKKSFIPASQELHGTTPYHQVPSHHPPVQLTELQLLTILSHVQHSQTSQEPY